MSGRGRSWEDEAGWIRERRSLIISHTSEKRNLYTWRRLAFITYIDEMDRVQCEEEHFSCPVRISRIPLTDPIQHRAPVFPALVHPKWSSKEPLFSSLSPHVLASVFAVHVQYRLALVTTWSPLKSRRGGPLFNLASRFFSVIESLQRNACQHV